MSLAKNLERFENSSRVIRAIYSRKASRKYSSRKVTSEDVQELLQAATQAPSAMNSQPWAFVVIQNKELLRRISETARIAIRESAALAKDPEQMRQLGLHDPDFDIFYGAGTLIVICMRQGNGFCPVGDCYLAGQNLMLAAEALGLGTCPIGFARDTLQAEELRAELAIPKDYVPVLPIIVGHSTDTEPKVKRSELLVLNWLE